MDKEEIETRLDELLEAQETATADQMNANLLGESLDRKKANRSREKLEVLREKFLKDIEVTR